MNQGVMFILSHMRVYSLDLSFNVNLSHPFRRSHRSHSLRLLVISETQLCKVLLAHLDLS